MLWGSVANIETAIYGRFLVLVEVEYGFPNSVSECRYSFK